MLHLHLHLHALVLSLALVRPAASTPPATEPPSVTEARETEQSSALPPAPLFIHLELDLSKLPAEDAPYFERDIRAAIEPLLSREPVVLADDSAHRLVIHVELLDSEALDYAIDFELLIGERPLDPPIERRYCRTCAQIEVVEQVALGLPRALATLQAALAISSIVTAAAEPLPPADPPRPIASPAPPAPSAPAPIYREPPDPPPPPPPPHVRWLGPVGWLGVVLAVGGTTTVGLATAAIGPQPSPVAKLLSFDRDPERSGWLLYGMGLGITSIGGAMLAADVTSLRERRVRRARRVTAHPTLTRMHTGLVVSARF
jgi:hypothetical protein